MSIYGTMKTAVSGMNAQANRLSTVGDNIANVNTTAYKKVSTAFSSFVLPSTSGSYNSGGVNTTIINSTSQQGMLTSTTSDTDLAIQGEGFFPVQDAGGTNYLTRVGSFKLNEYGNLVNAAGFTVMGAALGDPVNTFDNLTPIQIKAYELTAVPSTVATANTNLNMSTKVGETISAAIAGNLNSAASTVAVANRPSTNAASATFTQKLSVSAYDSAGVETKYDVFLTKTGTNSWEAAIYDAADAHATNPSGFPYSSAAAGTLSLAFNSSTGALQTVNGSTTLTSTVDGIAIDFSKMTQTATAASVSMTMLPAASDYDFKTSMTTFDAGGTKIQYDMYYTKLSNNTWQLAIYDAADASSSSVTGFPYANGPATTATLNFDPATYGLATVDGSTDLSVTVNGIKIDMTTTTQLNATNFSKVAADGSAPSSLEKITIDNEGIVYAVYESGTQMAIAQIPLATVISPDNLRMGTGNVYSITSTSGSAVFGFAGEPGFGDIVSGALESSNVDLASELTEMIEAQRSYTANSKVFQTGADVMDVLINLKR